MALLTPRSGGRLPHTPRMSERKRALFQCGPGSRSSDSAVCGHIGSIESGDSDSCDLGIMSPIDSSDSSEPFDQSVPQTPNSWRGKSQSQQKQEEKCRRKTARQILKSPLTFKNYFTRQSLANKHEMEHSNVRLKLVDILADTESCSSSLQDLTFHTDSDLSDTKENTPSKRSRKKPSKYPSRKSKRLQSHATDMEHASQNFFKSSLKNLKCEIREFQLPDEYIKNSTKEMMQHSPSRILKTPYENVINVKTPPRISHNRRTLKECSSNSPSKGNSNKKGLGEVTDETDGDTSNHKISRLNLSISGPKARLSLFNNPDAKYFLSPKSFYPKSNISLDTSFGSESSMKMSNPAQSKKKNINRHPSSRLSYRRSRKRRLGEINMGVRHGIRKPKQSKYSILTKDQRLKLALKIIDNSPLNNYINNYMIMKKSNITIHGLQPIKSTISNIENGTTDDLAKATGLSQNQLNKMDTILKQLGCTKSLNTILYPENKTSSETDETFQSTEDIEDTPCENESSPSNNKFFKSSRRAAELKKASFHKFYQSAQRQSKDRTTLEEKLTMLQNIVQFDVSDLLNNDEEDHFNTPEKNSIEALLTQWSEEEVPENEPQIITKNFATNKDTTPQERMLFLGETNFKSSNISDNFFTNKCHSESNDSPITVSSVSNFNDPLYVPNLNGDSNGGSDKGMLDSAPGLPKSSNCQFLPVDGGYILVNVEEMMDSTDAPCNLETIDSELQALDKQIFEMAKLNNINPDLLLSPTTDQMCTLASGLALSSPKDHAGLLDVNNLLTYRNNPAVSESESGQQCLENANDANDKKRKLFPVFVKDCVKVKQARYEENMKVRKSKTKFLSEDESQYQIDAGQKNFGATQCKDCGVIYQIGDAKDENDHMNHHLALDILKFNGWKNERVCDRIGAGRILVVQSGDPQSHWQRVTDLLERVVHPQLGYAAPLAPHKSYKVYLFVESRKLIGCLVAEQLQEAYKLLQDGDIDCCSAESYPVMAGISRVWTHTSHRKKGVATNLLNSMRANFYFGHILANYEIAFSSPTISGKAFAEKYTKTPNFYVYLN